MKKSIIAVGLLTYLLSGCSGSNNNNVTPSSTLNATETKLVGTWYLKKEVASDGSVVTSFTGTPYVEFQSALFDANNNKKLRDAADLTIPTIATNSTGAALRGSSTADIYWSFDETAQQLLTQIAKFHIDTLNTNTLKIHSVSVKDTLWFQK